MSVYKGENVIAGGSIDTYFVRKPAWSRAISITLAQLKAGYAAPEDGMFIGYINPLNPENTYMNVTINGLDIGLFATWGVERSYLNLSSQVNQGDVIQCTGVNTVTSISLSFVPFEDSTIAEPEVVTPELIRNLHDPDWSQAESITAAQLTAGWTATKRGIITGMCHNMVTQAWLYLYINGKTVAATFSGATQTQCQIQCPVTPGDKLTANANVTTAALHFVPYKAQ